MARPLLVHVQPGEVVAIPLFLTSEPALTRFRTKAFQDRGDEFVFCRVIEQRGGAGIIVEVFDRVGGLGTDIADVTAADRLFRPVAITGLGIHKKRWPRMGVCDPYDRERDSGYSQIQLVLSPYDCPRLWQDGVETPTDVETAKEYESWRLWSAPDLEQRIVDALGAGRARRSTLTAPEPDMGVATPC